MEHLPQSLTILQAAALSRTEAGYEQDHLDLILDAFDALDILEETIEALTPPAMVDEALAPFGAMRAKLQAALDDTPATRDRTGQ